MSWSSRGLPTAVTLLAGAVCLLTMACAWNDGAESMTQPELLMPYVLSWLFTLLGALVLQRRRDPAAPVGGAVPELDAYEVAQLGLGERVAVDSAITALITNGALSVDEKGDLLRIRADLPDDAPGLERRIHAFVARGDVSIPLLRTHAGELTRSTSQRFKKLGLVARKSSAALCLALAVPVAVAARIPAAKANEPVALPVVLALAGLGLAFALFWPRVDRTRLAGVTLSRLRTRYEPLRARTAAAELAAAGTLPLAAGLFGLAAVDTSGLPPWRTHLFPKRSEREEHANSYDMATFPTGGHGSGCGVSSDAGWSDGGWGDSGSGDGGGGGD